MSYQALYRKFRPQEFEDVKGQEHIVTTLKNQIKAGVTTVPKERTHYCPVSGMSRLGKVLRVASN